MPYSNKAFTITASALHDITVPTDVTCTIYDTGGAVVSSPVGYSGAAGTVLFDVSLGAGTYVAVLLTAWGDKTVRNIVVVDSPLSANEYLGLRG